MSGKKEKKNRFIVLNILVLFVYPFMLSASPRQSVCHVRCLFLLLFLSLSLSLSPVLPFSVLLVPPSVRWSRSHFQLCRSPRTTLPFFVRAETIPLGQFSMHGLARFFAASTPIFRWTIRRSAPGFRPPRDASDDTRVVQTDARLNYVPSTD